MSEYKDISNILIYVADCIRYFERMSNLHDCNDCAKKDPPTCQYLPKLGESTRVNCPLWKGEK